VIRQLYKQEVTQGESEEVFAFLDYFCPIFKTKDTCIQGYFFPSSHYK